VSFREIFASVLLLTGVAFNLFGAVGLLRFPGILPRMHAATKALTLGLSSVLLGSALVIGTIRGAAQLLLVAGFQFIAAPVAAHMVGRAVYRAYPDARQQLSLDELSSKAD
jgi:multicomponent Na+:H+ antiporter subunit G